MARVAVKVNRALLEESLKEAEKNGPLSNLSELWNVATNIYNKKAVEKITFSVVMLRTKEWNIQVKTVAGKRGRGNMTEEQKAAMAAGRGKRTPRSEKMKDFKDTFDAIQKRMEADSKKRRFLPVLERARDGSLTAAIKINCLECSGWVTSEIRECVVTKCSLYPHRPYKGSADEEDELQGMEDVDQEFAA